MINLINDDIFGHSQAKLVITVNKNSSILELPIVKLDKIRLDRAVTFHICPNILTVKYYSANKTT